MSDISGFPAITTVLWNDGPTRTFKAGEAISAGHVVGGASAGTSEEVVRMNATSGESPIGVALFTAASGEKVTVCMPGSICELVNADDSTAIDAFDYVKTNNNSVHGTVSSCAGTGGTPASGDQVVGMALMDIAGGSTGKVLIMPMVFP